MYDISYVSKQYKTRVTSMQLLYTYLIDTRGQYTIESLKAYKSLEAYNFFYNMASCVQHTHHTLHITTLHITITHSTHLPPVAD